MLHRRRAVQGIDDVSGCALTLSSSPGARSSSAVCPAAPVAVSPVFSSGAALIRRIMDLTPQQVEALPADQKAQVIALQAQVVSSPLVLPYCSAAIVRLSRTHPSIIPVQRANPSMLA